MSKGVVLYGCGGHGRVVHDIIINMKGVFVTRIVDDDPQMVGRIIDNVEVMGVESVLKQLLADGVVEMAIGVGDNHVRSKLFTKWQEAGFTMINAIHPSAIVSQNVKFGSGVVIMPGVVINTGSEIGSNTCVNTGATIDHDNKLGEHVNIGPGVNLAGGVSVGNYTNIFTNATINPNVSIGSKVVVGSGAVVLSDIPDNVTVAGMPAQIIFRKTTEEIR